MRTCVYSLLSISGLFFLAYHQYPDSNHPATRQEIEALCTKVLVSDGVQVPQNADHPSAHASSLLLLKQVGVCGEPPQLL